MLLAALNSSGAQIFLSYFKVGGTLVLSPASAYGKNLLAEWVKGSIQAQT